MEKNAPKKLIKIICDYSTYANKMFLSQLTSYSTFTDGNCYAFNNDGKEEFNGNPLILVLKSDISLNAIRDSAFDGARVIITNPGTMYTKT